MLKTLCLTIIIIAVSYLVVILILFFSQKKMIFFPSANMAGVPAEIGIDFEDVYFRTADGVTLNGWFIPAENAEYTVLFCHGNGGNISHRLDSVSLFNQLPVNLYIFDYRGYGKSGGEVTGDAGLYRDVEAAWRYLTETRSIQPGKIIVVGRSLGGAIAAYAAAENPAGGLVLESTFSSLPAIAKKKMPWIPAWLLKYKLSTVDSLAKVKCPVMITGSPDDEIVPFCFSSELFEKAPEPKIFLKLTGGHDDCYFLCRTKYVSALRKFFEMVGKQ
ncbi:MAG: alpha/beta hydrolase [Victivallales bacterium]